MHDFQITFTHPWLLLLIIPAVAVVLVPFFLLSKKYRRNRNRVVSVILHLCVSLCCVLLLSGMGFSYKIDNSENEILIVVDASYSTEEEKEAKDGYIEEILSLADPDVYRVGIVTFGFEQQYAAPLSNDMEEVYSSYLASVTPDTSATDIAAALEFAREQFTQPESAKIVLLSDGVETDERAQSVIRTIAAEGIRVDTVACSSLYSDSDVRLLGAQTPDYNILPGETFEIGLTLHNSFPGETSATVTLYDNDGSGVATEVTLAAGTQTVTIPHAVDTEGLHTLRFEIDCASDAIGQNNSYYTYLFLTVHDNILIVESYPGQSAYLVDLLDDYNTTVLSTERDQLPSTLDELRGYDEIIFNNIANSDLEAHEGFIELVNDYVYEIGGGLFTVGGSDAVLTGDEGEDVTAHAYNRDDMAGTLYQQMLPVQAIDYTPPLGLMIVVDVSGSMSVGGDGDISKLDAAKNSAVSIIRDETCLSERDYCGVMALSDSYSVGVTPLPLTRQYEIIQSVYNLSEGGGTVFSPAIEHASIQLLSLYNQGLIEKMHVIVLTDGAASDFEEYLSMVELYHERGVSFTFVAVDSDAYIDQLNQATNAGNDYRRENGLGAVSSSVRELTQELRDDIRIPAIKEVEYGEFTPTLNENSGYASVISQENMPSLYGFYGTRVRSSDYLVLSGEYGVPIYAEWKYGAGTVGSFMCELSGAWSEAFRNDETGQTLLRSIVTKLFPTRDIRPSDITVSLREENYITQMSIFLGEELAEGESVRVEVSNLSDPDSVVRITQPTETDGFSRASFIALDSGIYAVTVSRIGAEGQILSSQTVYKSFSYSAEYLPTEDDAERLALLQSLAELGGGTASSLAEGANAWDTFSGFVTELARTYDPRLILGILAIVLFLLDIAVRKFKFKWPHELIREHREKKLQQELQK